jgi:2-oxoglutarate ferredoxin oxidoreductase subunit beta
MRRWPENRARECEDWEDWHETDQRLANAYPARRNRTDRNLAEAPLMNDMTTITTAKDWASDQEVRWCPGCGDYAVLKAVQRTMPDLGVAREKTVFISGIGCSSRFPYYMASYGFHTIHGRAPAVATGVKLANPDLDVWIITGDGDALSIGGNHTMHILRRNLDCQILLFNNEIYGLTKGQYSPTSRVGTRSPSTPFGSVDRPVTPCMFALGSGARFIARGIDVHKNLPDVLKAAHAHKGASFVEIYQNCVVYNDDVFAGFTEREVAAEKQLWLKPGEKMLFANGAKGLALDTERLCLKVVEGKDPAVITHDPKNKGIAAMLIEMPQSFPVALGVIYEDPAPTFDSAVIEQNKAAASGKQADLQALVSKGQTWMVEKEPHKL